MLRHPTGHSVDAVGSVSDDLPGAGAYAVTTHDRRSSGY
jgi:hypothetical protein